MRGSNEAIRRKHSETVWKLNDPMILEEFKKMSGPLMRDAYIIKTSFNIFKNIISSNHIFLMHFMVSA